jgi:hypothetical protein
MIGLVSRGGASTGAAGEHCGRGRGPRGAATWSNTGEVGSEGEREGAAENHEGDGRRGGEGMGAARLNAICQLARL